MMKRDLRSALLISGVPLVLFAVSVANGAAEKETLLEQSRRDQTAVCTDGKSHYVAIAPHDRLSHELFYGDGKKFYQIDLPPPMTLTGLHFLDPRVVSKTGNPNFRGVDVRQFSQVEFDAEKKTCSVRCGDRVTKLNLLDADKGRAMMSAAKVEPSPQKYKPYALVRDDTGVYYYVDKGATPQNAGSFRLYRGPKGALKPETMTNVVSDSEGDIFATKTGSLRLILDKRESAWVEDAKRTKLTVVPVQDNLQLIYTDLVVYAGQALGTPCDHM